MRDLIKLIQQKYGKIAIETYRKWEKTVDQDEQLQKSLKILSKVLRQRAYPSQPKAQELGKNTERPGHYT